MQRPTAVRQDAGLVVFEVAGEALERLEARTDGAVIPALPELPRWLRILVIPKSIR